MQKLSTQLNFLKGISLFQAAFRDSTIRNLSIIFLLFETGWALYFQYISLYLVEAYGYTPQHIGLYLAFVGLVFSAALLVGMRILLRVLPLEKILSLGLWLCLLGIGWMCLSHSTNTPWLSAMPTNIGLAFAFSTTLTLYSNTATADRQGWIMGISWSVVSMAWLLSGSTCGLLAALGATVPFWVAGILVLTSILFFRK